MEQAARDDFFPSVIASRMVDGKIYALPYEVEPMAMYYSVDAFKEIGLTEKDVPKTWDELLDVAKKLTNAKRFGVLFETNPGYYQNFTWYPFLWEGGGDFQTKDGKSAFNSPATVQALKFWQDSINMGVAPRKPLGGGGWDVVPNLASGYCAMQNIGIWAIANLREGAPDFKYGVFKLPTPPGGKYITIGGGWAFVANAKGANPKAAGEFCAWALGSMKPDSIERIVDWCTKAKSDMPPRKSALEAGKAAYRERLPQGVHRRRSIRAPAASRACLRQSTRRSPTRSRPASSTDRTPSRRRRPRPSRSTPSSPATRARRSSDAWIARVETAGGRRTPRRPPAVSGPQLSNRARERLAGYLFVAPDAIGLLIFVGGPMILSLSLGFFSVSGFGEYSFVGLANYRRMIGRPALLEEPRASR